MNKKSVEDVSVQGKRVLDAGLAAGYAMPYSCRAGTCRTCRGKIIEGKVSADVMAKVKEREAAIKSGSFTVTIDDSEPKSS